MSGWLSSGAHSGDGIALVLFGIVWYCMVLCIGCCQGGYRGHILGMGRVSGLSPEVLIPISTDT